MKGAGTKDECIKHQDDIIKELRAALLLAVQYVGKGVADGAYDGCVVSGESALSRIEETLRKTGSY